MKDLFDTFNEKPRNPWADEQSPNDAGEREEKILEKQKRRVAYIKRFGHLGHNGSGRQPDGSVTVELRNAAARNLGVEHGHTAVLDPLPCRTLEDMSEEEIQELERIYGAPVRRPSRGK